LRFPNLLSLRTPPITATTTVQLSLFLMPSENVGDLWNPPEAFSWNFIIINNVKIIPVLILLPHIVSICSFEETRKFKFGKMGEKM